MDGWVAAEWKLQMSYQAVFHSHCRATARVHRSTPTGPRADNQRRPAATLRLGSSQTHWLLVRVLFSPLLWDLLNFTRMIMPMVLTTGMTMRVINNKHVDCGHEQINNCAVNGVDRDLTLTMQMLSVPSLIICIWSVSHRKRGIWGIPSPLMLVHSVLETHSHQWPEAAFPFYLLHGQEFNLGPLTNAVTPAGPDPFSFSLRPGWNLVWFCLLCVMCLIRQSCCSKRSVTFRISPTQWLASLLQLQGPPLYFFTSPRYPPPFQNLLPGGPFELRTNSVPRWEKWKSIRSQGWDKHTAYWWHQD